MIRIKLFLVCAFCFLNLNAQDNSSDITQRITKQVTSFMKKYNVPGATVVLYINGTPYQFQYGYADRDAQIPVTKETLFELGSISKIFTVLLLAQEIQADHMRLDDSITLYIPELRSNKALTHMTLEQLATHTAHLPFNAPENVKNTQELIEHMKQWKPPIQEPVWWKYSNHGIELLRIALERYTGKTFNELLITRILKPLGMGTVGVTVPHSLKKYYAKCYDQQGNTSIPWNDGYLIGSAAIKVSSTDIQQFLKAAIGLEGVPVSLLSVMRMTQLPSIDVDCIKHGFAWEISDIKTVDSKRNFDWPTGTTATIIDKDKRVFDREALYEKGGTTNGFHAFLAVIPGKKSGIAIMINKRRYNGWKVLKKLGRDILMKSFETH